MKDLNVIPSGPYCYDENGTCPYWRLIKNRPVQYNGWCDFMEKGDLELEQEFEVTNENTGEKMKGSDVPFPISLLWDQCKECGIADDDEEYE